MPLCALCGRERPESDLRDSHIIPEFLYQELYDEGHGLAVVASEQPDLPRRRYKGVYQQRFLCCHCESQLCAHEDYVAKAFRSRVSVVPAPDAIRFTGLDYRHMKLFEMSVLWRASATNREEFGGVSLGRRQEALRAMVAGDDPGACSDFPCVVVTNAPMRERFGQQLIVPGVMGRDHDGQRVAVFYFGSLFWWFFVSRHACRSSRAPYFLHEDGTFSIIRSDDPPWPWLTPSKDLS